MPKMNIGLFIGRFQPFHNGHLAIIKLALQKVDRLKIVLGSAQISRTTENPFNVKERQMLLEAALQEAGITRYELFTVEDIPKDEEYPTHVKKKVGDFEIVFAGENKIIRKLFTEAGYKVITSARLNGWIATEIRQRMRQNQEYQGLVPKKVHAILKTRAFREIMQQTAAIQPA